MALPLRAPSGSGWLQERGSPEKEEEQQQQPGGWLVNAAAGYQHLHPFEVSTDVGVDTGSVGPTTAHSPAHDSNLIPQPFLFTGQGSA